MSWVFQGQITPFWSGIATHNGVALGIDGFNSVFKSVDGGQTWTPVSAPTLSTGVGLGNLINDGTKWIYANDGQHTFSSTDDGSTWSKVSTGGLATGGIGCIGYNGSGAYALFSNFIPSSGELNFAESADGVTWAHQQSLPAAAANIGSNSALNWDGAQFIGVGFGPFVLTSPDGIAWTITAASTHALSNVCFGASKYVATDATAAAVYVSSTAIGLASAASTPIAGLSGNCNACEFISGNFYVFDSVGNVATSPDAVSWTVDSLNFPGSDTVIDATFDSTNNSIIAYSNNGYVSTLHLSSSVSVPNVVGDTLPQATATLTGVNFVVGLVTIQASNTVASGVVISQSPVGGTSASPGTAINLVMSMGPASIISKLTQKLLLSLHRPFDKDPHPQLAFRIQYDGTGLTWSILNGVLTLTATGGTGTSHTFNIANFMIGQLAQFIAALPGYSVPYQDTSAYALLSALALLDSSGSINVSNGDHVFGYTTLLWAWMDANSSELGAAKAQIDNALLQMNTIDAQDEWLDYHGTFYNVPRQQGELDPGYSPRMIASVLQPRGNNIAIAEAIKSITQAGQSVFVIDAINDTSFAITYNGLIHFDGSEFYDAGLGPNGAYGFFDVDFSFDFAGSVSQSTYYAQILTTVEDFRDGGTQLRAVIFRNNGSTTTVISDTFVGRVRVIVYDDFTGSTYRLLEDGSTRFNEDGTARILET